MAHNCTLSDKELAAKATQLLDKLIKSGGESFVMQIPAKPNEDLDLVFSELISRFQEYIQKKKVKCPECLCTVRQEELDTFGGLCEDCNHTDF